MVSAAQQGGEDAIFFFFFHGPSYYEDRVYHPTQPNPLFFPAAHLGCVYQVGSQTLPREGRAFLIS